MTTWNRTKSLRRWLSDGVDRYLSTQVAATLPVSSCLGYLALQKPPGAGPRGWELLDPAAPPAPGLTSDVILRWVHSGDLTWGEAEALLALDEATPWNTGG